MQANDTNFEYPARLHGETDLAYLDLAYLKWAADALPVPSDLPESHGDYFEMAEAAVVPVDRLRAAKSAAETMKSSLNAAKFMAAARAGRVSKRAPLRVLSDLDGIFRVLDGNSTLAPARSYGWTTIPITEDPPASR